MHMNVLKYLMTHVRLCWRTKARRTEQIASLFHNLWMFHHQSALEQPRLRYSVYLLTSTVIYIKFKLQSLGGRSKNWTSLHPQTKNIQTFSNEESLAKQPTIWLLVNWFPIELDFYSLYKKFSDSSFFIELSSFLLIQEKSLFAHSALKFKSNKIYLFWYVKDKCSRTNFTIYDSNELFKYISYVSLARMLKVDNVPL